MVRIVSGKSRPARARGLKQPVLGVTGAQRKVAPRAGAWIETHHTVDAVMLENSVAPRAGAWIETH